MESLSGAFLVEEKATVEVKTGLLVEAEAIL
jgi:hypothetical protein